MVPPIFNGEKYNTWVVRMETYLEVLDLWEAVKEGYILPCSLENLTATQLKNHNEKKTSKSKANTYLFTIVSFIIFTCIMSLKSTNVIWDYLKTKYEGDDRIKSMQVMNLVRDFESEFNKEYFERLLNIENKVRLLGYEFKDSRIIEKFLITIPKRFVATISILENINDLSIITLVELLNSLQA